MKSMTHANRGAALEEFVKFANSRYRRECLAHIEKQNTEFIPLRDRNGKLVSCKVEEKATFDFLGRYKHYPIAIEAKNSNDNTIRWDRVEDNQARDMDDFCKEPGTIGIVLVGFGLRSFYAIPWVFWSKAYDTRARRGDRKALVTVEAFGTTWTIPQKASIREDEIPPEFRVDGNNSKYGLHYLANAEKYITTQP